jgi:hypothetical protein
MLLHVAEQRRGQGLSIRGIGNTCFLAVSAFQAESPRVGSPNSLPARPVPSSATPQHSIVYGGRSARAGATSNGTVVFLLRIPVDMLGASAIQAMSPSSGGSRA